MYVSVWDESCFQIFLRNIEVEITDDKTRSATNFTLAANGCLETLQQHSGDCFTLKNVGVELGQSCISGARSIESDVSFRVLDWVIVSITNYPPTLSSLIFNDSTLPIFLTFL